MRRVVLGQNSATRSSRWVRQARLTRHVFRGAATAWTGVDMSISLFSKSCSWDWCKSRAQKTSLVHASTTASSSSVVKHDSTRSSWCAQHVVRVVSRCDVMSKVEFGLKWWFHCSHILPISPTEQYSFLAYCGAGSCTDAGSKFQPTGPSAESTGQYCYQCGH